MAARWSGSGVEGAGARGAASLVVRGPVEVEARLRGPGGRVRRGPGRRLRLTIVVRGGGGSGGGGISEGSGGRIGNRGRRALFHRARLPEGPLSRPLRRLPGCGR